jgi:hypothetical protein
MYKIVTFNYYFMKNNKRRLIIMSYDSDDTDYVSDGDIDDCIYELEIFEEGGEKQFVHEMLTMTINEQNENKKETSIPTFPTLIITKLEGNNEFFDEAELKYVSEEENRPGTLASILQLLLSGLTIDIIPRFHTVENKVDYSAQYRVLFNKFLPRLRANRKIENEVVTIKGYNKPFLLGITKLYGLVIVVLLNSVDNRVIVGIGY